MPEAITVLAAIGALTLLIFVIRFLAFILQYVFTSNSLPKFKGEWAVVTGASAGIGAGFTRNLAKRGINVILLARSTEKMQAIAEECETKYGVNTLVRTFDFAAATDADYTALASDIQQHTPKILVNNVGVNVELPTDFIDLPVAEVDRIVKVNIESTNKMTAMLLPGMLSAEKGIIYCLSSGGGAVSPGPLLSPYAGTKAYADAFAVSLSGEVAGTGVLVHSLTPFFVESAMAKMRKSLTVPSVDAFADKALNQTGISPRLSPHWAHYVMGALVTSLPLSVQVSQIANLHRTLRAKALRKIARLAKQN